MNLERIGLCFGLSVAVMACADEASPGGRLCPTCTPQTGGETTDFGGGQENCRETVEPASPSILDEYQVEAAIAAVTEPLVTTFRWNPLFTGAEARADTSLHIAFRLETASYESIGVEASNACRNKVKIPVTADLTTTDGAVAASLRGWLDKAQGDLVWRMRARADLAEVEGNPPIQTDQTYPHVGDLELTLTNYPTGWHGNLTASLVYFLDGPMSADTVQAAMVLPSTRYESLLLGSFPADVCGGWGFPVDAETPHPWLGGQSPQSALAAAIAALPAQAGARWVDGTTTELFTTADAPVPVTTCLHDHFGNPRFLIDLPTHLRSTDSRLDATFAASHELEMIGVTGAPSSLAIYRQWDSLSATEVKELGVFSGLNLADGELANVDLEAHYQWDQGLVTGGGILDIYGNETRIDCIAWPPGSEYYVSRCRQPTP
ncbi:MAG: hypothetical protein ACM3ZE_24105 [Myxococcales bacterium]